MMQLSLDNKITDLSSLDVWMCQEDVWQTANKVQQQQQNHYPVHLHNSPSTSHVVLGESMKTQDSCGYVYYPVKC